FKDLPCLTFDGRAVFGSSHWKVDAIDEYAGDRPAAWIDDNMNEECRFWAVKRSAPTLLVETQPSEGLTDEHVDGLGRWAAARKARVCVPPRGLPGGGRRGPRGALAILALAATILAGCTARTSPPMSVGSTG